MELQTDATPSGDVTPDEQPTGAQAPEGGDVQTPDGGDVQAPEAGDETPSGDQGLEKPGATEDQIADDEAPKVYENDLVVDAVSYGDQTMNAVIPKDLANTFSQAGLDAVAITTELYTDDFGLSEETTASIAEKLGLPSVLVSQAIQGYKAQNDITVNSIADNATKMQEATEKAWDSTVKQIGGESNWGIMQTWAQGKWDAGKFTQFNKVMQSGDRYMQELAIGKLMQDYEASAGTLNMAIQEGGDNSADLKGDVYSKGFLTKGEYNILIKSGDYGKMSKAEQANVDTLRRKGHSKGQ